MDPATAQQILETAITQKTDEILVFSLALSVLQGTFKNDLTSLTTAQQEANDLAAQLQTEKAKSAALQAQIDAATAAAQPTPPESSVQSSPVVLGQ